MSNLVFDESSSNREASHGYAWWFSGDTFEKAMAEERKPRKRSLMHRLTTHPGRLTILYFMMLVALSTLLLLTPTATPKGEQTTFTTAFFTAISAISTCGISIVNSTTHWSAFGQAVLIFSVQMGGLGVMTFASLIALAVNHHLKATQKLLTANEIIRYVRAMSSSAGQSMIALSRIMDSKAEAMEFIVPGDAPYVGIPFKNLTIQPNTIVAAIARGREVIIPSGGDILLGEDRVVVITGRDKSVGGLEEIFRGERAELFRAAVRENALPTCRHCPWRLQHGFRMLP